MLAEPTSQLRCGPHAAARDRGLPRDRARPARRLAPDLVLRFGDMPTSKPLRAWIAMRDCDQIVSTPPAAGTSRRAAPGNGPRRPGPQARGIAERLRPAPSRRSLDGAWTAVGRAGVRPDRDRRARRRSDDQRARDPPRARRPARRRRTRPARLEHADPRPGVVHAGGARRCGSSPNRGANGIDGLVSTAAGIARGPAAHLGRHG